MAFLESPRFPDRISYGSAVGPVYNTDVIEFSNGDTQSLQRWQYPLIEFNVAYGLRRQEDLYEIIEFFHAVAGRANGFRIRDHTDFRSSADQLVLGSYEFTDQQIGVGDGIETDFQLIKSYVKGSFTRVRNITKPVVGTVKIGFDAVEQVSGFTVDYTTGIVTFAVAPTAAVVISAGYEFDVPAKFSSDKLDFNLATYQIQGTSIPVRSIR